MSLFDTLKEKAAELLGGAGDKVSELTGVDLSAGEAAVDQASQAAGDLAETGQGLADTATETGQGIVDSAGPLGETATGLAGDVIDPNARG